MGPPVNAAALVERLAGVMGSRATLAPGVLEQHGRSEAYHASLPPDVVVFPQSTAEVVEIVKLCASLRMPIIPFGAGTSLEGNTAAVAGGVSIDFSGMNRVIAVNADDMDVVVEPGITRKQLNTQLRDTGLFFPIDPGADASIGGMTSTRASGTMAVRYGTMKDNVMALEVVLADGRVIRTAKRARKSASGYDLTRLLVGAEGTLGVITEVTLKLHPLPQAISAAVCSFDSLKDAVDTAITVIQSAIPVARIELLDDVMMRGINAYAKLGYWEAPTLFFEFHGSDAGVAEQAEAAQAIAADHAGAVSNGRARRRNAAGFGTPVTTRFMPVSACVPVRARSSPTSACRFPRRMPDSDPPRRRRKRVHRADRRPCRRRQFPHVDPRRPGPARGDRPCQGAARPHGRARDRHERHLDRRARHRTRQDRLSRRGTRRSRRCDARHQGGA